MVKWKDTITYDYCETFIACYPIRQEDTVYSKIKTNESEMKEQFLKTIISRDLNKW